jgi:tetratricopeptide (TPR) repeat protein
MALTFAVAIACAALSSGAAIAGGSPAYRHGQHGDEKDPTSRDGPDDMGAKKDPKKKPSSDGAAGTPAANEAGDAGKTVKSRARRLATLLNDAAADGRAAFLATAEGESIDAAAASLPKDCPPKIRASIDDARRLLGLGKWADALATATDTIAADGRFGVSRLIAARALEAQGRASDALSQQLDPAVASAPDDANALHVRAIVQWGTGNLDAARKDLVRALAARPSDGRILLSFGVLDAERKSFDDAAASLLRATDERGDDVVAWRGLARSMYFSGDWPGAVASLERVVRIVEGPQPVPGGRPALDARVELCVLYADRIADREKAKAQAAAFLNGGGVDLPLDAWLKALVAK